MIGLEFPILDSLFRHHNNQLFKCDCKKHCMDFHCDHTSTCTSHSGVTKLHDWMVGVLGQLFRTARHTVSTKKTEAQDNVAAELELSSYLQDAVEDRSLVFNLSMTHDCFGSSGHVQENSLL